MYIEYTELCIFRVKFNMRVKNIMNMQSNY